MQNKSFGKWLEEYIKVYKMPYCKSVKNHYIILKLHIPDYIKNIKLKNLNAFDIQKALNSIVASKTRQDTYNLYNGALTTAFKLGFIDKDIASLIIKPKHIRQVGSALSKEEIQYFLEKIEIIRCKEYFLFLLLTGCRRTEALNLTWEDINFNKNLIHIKGTKTLLADRFIPIFPKLKDLLISISKKGKKVFHHRADYVSKTFKKLLPNHKLHDLRHTFATICLENDINIKVVQLWLGHSRLDTTASIYSHITQDFAQEESKKFKI